jgi:hypothetical protein
MKRTAFKRKLPTHQPSTEREPKPIAKVTRWGTAGATSGVAVPKPVAQRNRALLDMAQERPCLLQVDGVCNGDTATTVACHSNLSEHGKAGARKADDHYSVWGCMACHRWLDQGTAAATRKEPAFMLAHLRQVLAWRQIATDPGEPERFRKAAQWALDLLNATPVGVGA